MDNEDIDNPIRIQWKHHTDYDGDFVAKSDQEPMDNALATLREKKWKLHEKLSYNVPSKYDNGNRSRATWISEDEDARLGYYEWMKDKDAIAFEIISEQYAGVFNWIYPFVYTSNFWYNTYSDMCGSCEAGEFDQWSPQSVLASLREKWKAVEKDRDGDDDEDKEDMDEDD